MVQEEKGKEWREEDKKLVMRRREKEYGTFYPNVRIVGFKKERKKEKKKERKGR